VNQEPTRPRSGWRGALIPLGAVALAQLVALVSAYESDILASPDAILQAGVRAMFDGTIVFATTQTLTAALAGLAIGGSLGLVFGVLLGLSNVLDRLMTFSIEAVRPIPSAAMIPVALLVFGFGFRMEISIVAFSTIWPVLILTRAAIIGIEPRLLEVSRVLGFGFLERVVKIIIPAALPRVFVAFRLATGIALIVAVTVEVTANPIGLGHHMMAAQQALNPALMLALLIWLALIGWALNALLEWMQRTLFGPAALVEVRT
jgi:ABC-type nitrate/sulfonate/bicarbonate transport system permease component